MYKKLLLLAISFMLFSNIIFAKNNIFNLREDEENIWVLTYNEDYYDSYILIKGIYDEECMAIIRPVPENAYNINVYGYQGCACGKKEMSYKIIKNKDELDEFLKEYPIYPEEYNRILKNLEEAREHENVLLGIIYPENLNISGKFTIQIIFKIKIDEKSEYYYGKNGFCISFLGFPEKFDRFSFVLPINYKFWDENEEGILEMLSGDKEAKSWQIGKNNIEYLYVTFGTPEERLYWGNRATVYWFSAWITIGIFLAITCPIMFSKFDNYRKYKKWILLSALLFCVICLVLIRFRVQELPILTDLSTDVFVVMAIFVSIYTVLWYMSSKVID